MDQEEKSPKKIVDLFAYRRKKELTEQLARGRQPLFVSHQRGEISGSPHFKRPEASEDFGDRLQRIRAGLERINALMDELKKISHRRETQKPKEEPK